MTALYPRNAWYPLTWADRITQTLGAHRVLGEDLVAYRTEAGEAVAMADICPHRMAPLSIGKLRGDAIECGYHGMTFGRDGICTRIPGQAHVPATARVRSYPVVERMGLAWIWMGDPAAADPAEIVTVPEYDDPNWSSAQGDALEIDANYLNLADNLCDPSHVSFVHLSTLGSAASEDIPVDHRATKSGVLVWRWILDGAPIPIFAKYGSFEGNVDRWHYYDYQAPCSAIIDFGSAEAGAIKDHDKRDRGMRIFACHFITPVDEHRCIDHWMHVRNFALGDRDVDTRLHADFRIAFDEDKTILERIDRNERENPDFKRIHLSIDAAPRLMRRAVSRMAETESDIQAVA
jgi:phenylpropionate dioxygenase-like ring-hydroxylating dioxygenase large terminal subunit